MMCSGRDTSSGHPQPSERQTFFPSFWNCGGPLQQGEGDGSSMQTTDDSSISGCISASASAPPPRTVRSVMNGIMSPFINCVQPPLQSTCGAPTMSWEPRGGVQHQHQHQPSSSLVSPDGGYYGKEVGLSSHQQEMIVQPHVTDILCGRGGSSSRHMGNQYFRELIAANKARYSSLTKKQKMMLAREIVDLIHGADPPGRFRARDLHTGYWCDIGLPRSLEKTSQALREKPSSSSSSSNAAARTSPISDIMDSTDMDDQPETIVSAPSDVSDQHTHVTQATQATMSTVAAGNKSGNTNIYSNAITKNKSSRNTQASPVTIPPHLRVVYAPRITKHETATTAASAAYPQIPRLQEMSPYPGSFHHRAQMLLPSRVSSQEQSHQVDHGRANSGLHPPASLHLRPTNFYADAFEVSWPSEPAMSMYRDAPSPPPPPPGFTRSSCSSGAGSGVYNGPASIMRQKSDISPARQQEWKRQRISTSPRSATFDTANNNSNIDKNSNESSQLEYAIKSQLSLEERVIRPLTSPAALQQGRTMVRLRPSTLSKGSSFQKISSSATANTEATTDLDGLAALSTAAFLRLDESH